MKSLAITATILLSSSFWISASGQSLPACLGNPDEDAALRGWVLEWTTAPISDTARANRRAYFHLPPADSAEVVVVSDSATCEQSRASLSQYLGAAAESLSVVVVHADSVYVVVDPGQTAGEWYKGAVLGSQFQVLKGLLY